MQNSRNDIDFLCGCGEIVGITADNITADGIRAECPKCHKVFNFTGETGKKLVLLRNLVQSIRAAESIVGDCDIAVKVGEKEVKVPYALLLTRFNTLIKLPCSGEEMEFRLWIGSSQSLDLMQAAKMLKKG